MENPAGQSRPALNCSDLAWRQVAFFLPLRGYDPRRIFSEAQGPAVYRELDGPAVFVFGNKRHAVAGHRFTRPRLRGRKGPTFPP
jgi:hypothetical protein